jgi:ATP-binding cassette, subfamily B, bacterial CvaB/MchF/RaxB
VLQSEAAECGLACLAMVASYHGRKIDLGTLRRRFPPSLRGVTLRGLMNTAASLNLSTRALRLEPSQLAELQTPCILHWKMVHFVVLVRATANRIVVHDPAVGERTYRLDEVGERFTGVALELTPTSEFEPVHEEVTLRIRDLWTYSRGLVQSGLVVLLLSVLLQLAMLLTPLYTQLVVDKAVAQQDAGLLTVLALGFGLVLAFRATATYFRDYGILYASRLLSLQMGTNLVSHLVRLPMVYFERRHLSDVISRVRSIQPIESLLTTGFISALLDGMMAAVVLVMMLLYSVKLALLSLGIVLLFSAIRIALYRPVMRIRQEEIAAMAQEETSILETLRGMQAVKLLGIETIRVGLWQNRRTQAINAGVRFAKWDLAFATLNTVIFGVENLLIVYWAAQLTLAQEFSIGMMYAFLLYKTQWSDRMNALFDWLLKCRMLDVHLSRIADVAHTRPEFASEVAVLASGEIQGRIELRNVSFRYGENDPWVLQDVNMQIDAGSCVCLVGRSGSGKTTLLKLILGLLEPTQGEILIDGFRPEALGLRRYRQSIGSVMQDDHFFEGTIEENISGFDPDASSAKVQAAAQRAHIHTDIQAMPMGYQSLIGNMGAALSGGQRQRILIARALYRTPRIVLLDEGTAHLDPTLVVAMAESLGQMSTTRILVTHQTALLPIADASYVVEGGAVSRSPAALPAGSTETPLPAAATARAAGLSARR